MPKAKAKSPKTYLTAEEMMKTRPRSRVAEPVAIYHAPRRTAIARKSSSLGKHIGGYHASNEVWRFAVANDLIPHLERAIRLAREHFPSVRNVGLEYVIDPEIADNSWITIAIKDSGAVHEVLTQINRFDDEMINQTPASKRDKICLGVGGL